MINTVFLDMDGVITDFNKSVCEQFNLPYPPQVYYFFPEIRPQVNAFCDRLFWQNLEWMHDGRDILRAITELFEPEKVYLLTKIMPNVESASGKMIWIQNNLPVYFSRVIITSLGVPKSFMARPDVLLIDDNDKFVNEFREVGGKAILVPRPWNTSCSLADKTVLEITKQLRKINAR
jgi:5'(3')-deoxyribonucleotidase